MGRQKDEESCSYAIWSMREQIRGSRKFRDPVFLEF